MRRELIVSADGIAIQGVRRIAQWSRCRVAKRRAAMATDSGSITRILAYPGEPTKAPYIARPPAVLPGRRTSNPGQG
jgi:hypothetical protein